jgi:hypothetical protein
MYATRQNLATLFAIVEAEIVIADTVGDEIVLADDSDGSELPRMLEQLHREKGFTTFTVVDVFTLEHSDHECDANCGAIDDEHQHNENCAHAHAVFSCRVKLELSARIQVRLMQLIPSRTRFIERHYKRTHEYLFAAPLDWPRVLTDAVYQALIVRHDESRLQQLMRVVSDRTKLFSLALFQTQYCNDFVDEVERFEASGLPTSRPNSMNHYGVVVDEIGMESAMTSLCVTVAKPLVQLLYGSLGAASADSIDVHHAFVVQCKCCGFFLCVCRG